MQINKKLLVPAFNFIVLLLIFNNSYSQNIFIPRIDSLTTNTFTVINPEETADIFYVLPGYNQLDLTSFGQVSYISRNGSGYKNYFPRLKDIKLMSTTYGGWNLLNLPLYSFKELSFEHPFNSNSFNYVLRDDFPDVPVSEINYRYGDFGWNQVNISLKRKLTDKLYLNASGEKILIEVYCQMK